MFSRDQYINAHTHEDGDEQAVSVVNLSPGQLNKVMPERFYSFGIHPWYIPEKGIGKLLKEVEEAARMEDVVAIGECGLDKLSRVPLDLQQFVFEKHIEIAENVGKPLIIHCVKAANELVQVKAHTGSEVEWIVHGYNSNLHVADMLVRHEMFFSFGKALLNPHSNACKVLPQLEDELFLLETDDSNIPIMDVYTRAAELTGMELETLKLSMMTNFINIFKI